MKEEIEWFRPEDKLPDFNGNVLCDCREGIQQFKYVEIKWYEEGLFYHCEFDDKVCECVYAWAEMPKGVKL